MKAKRGPKKPAKDMTDDEVAEILFGKRTASKVRKELKAPEHTGNKEKTEEESSIEKKDS